MVNGSLPQMRPATATAQIEAEQAATNLNHLGSLRPLAQLRESFILAAGDEDCGLSTSMWPMSGCFLKKFYETARWRKCSGRGY